LLAVIVGAAIYFILGAAWYSPPLFARQWQAAIGWDESRPQPQTNPITYVVPAILYLIAAIATGLLAAATGTDTLTEGNHPRTRDRPRLCTTDGRRRGHVRVT